jgi:hypothetical protein
MKKQFFCLNNILLVVVIIMALIYVYVTYGTYKNFRAEQHKMRAFYVTNAGINQAIWYLSTPTSIGGYGPKWRTKDLKKYFSVGYYTISVEDGGAPGEIIITSRGEAEGTKLMLRVTAVYGRGLPRIFDYALYSGDELALSGSSKIIGNIYVNDNLRVKDDVAIIEGKAFTTPGYDVDIAGNPKFPVGRAPKPYPVFPVLDTSFYYEKIADAKSREKGVIQGDVNYHDLDLTNKILYVNGNVAVKGEIKGNGSLVCTRNMTVSDSKIGDGVSLIVNGKLRISGRNTVLGNAYFYSKQKLSVDDGSTIKGGPVILSPTVIEIGNKCNVSGLIYAPMINLGKDSTINGSIVAENFGTDGLLESVNIRYNQSFLPLTVIGFNMGSEVIMTKPGSLKEI